MILRFLLAFLFAFAGTTAVAETRYAESDGIRIAYEVRGSGDPLVLIPGFSQSRSAWESAGFVTPLVESGRRVILVDPRGHGESDKPLAPAAYTSEAVAADIVAVLDDLGIRQADLLGYSRGGWIALATAIEYPERVRSVIAGGAQPYAEDMSVFRAAVGGGLAKWVELIEGRVGPLPKGARAMFLANDAEALRAAVTADRGDVSESLASTGIPVLLYAGSKDPRASLARKFAATTPHAEFVEITGKGHFQAFFASAQVIEAIAAWERASVNPRP